MHSQHRYGAPSRPRQDDHTRWEREEDDSPWLFAAMVGVVALVLWAIMA